MNMKGITMKRLALAAALAIMATASRAAPITVITNYFAGYVSVTNGWATVADSGLAAGTAYVCIPLASLPALTASNAVANGTASDVRILMYAINDQAATAFTATATTNRPANTTITKSTVSTASTGYTIAHSVISKWTWPQAGAVLTPE